MIIMITITLTKVIMITITLTKVMMITMVMVIMIITRVGMNKGQQDEFTGLALYFGKNLSYVGK